jgi:sugar phosphate isomerase/epimerase
MARLLSLAAGVQIDVAPADMVTVAHDAGWPAVGIWFDGKTWTDSTSREVRHRLDNTGVVALDIEPIIPSEDGNDFAEHLIEAAAVIGARHILFTSRLKDQVRTTDRYQQVCEMARPHGIKVVCEFLPIFPLNTLSMAAEIVANSRATNGGVLIDNLHLSRSGSSIKEVRAMPTELFPYLQICDAPLQRPADFGALLDEALNGRLCPGEGSLPIVELLQAVPEVPLSFEVRSKFLRDITDPVNRAKHLLKFVQQTCGNF